MEYILLQVLDQIFKFLANVVEKDHIAMDKAQTVVDKDHVVIDKAQTAMDKDHVVIDKNQKVMKNPKSETLD